MTYTNYSVSSDKFDEVWKRVLKSKLLSDEESVGHFISEETAVSDALKRITKTKFCSSSIRKLLLDSVRERQKRIVRLKSRYYILTGEKYFPVASGFSCTLRELYEISCALSAGYILKAQSAAKPDIAAMYREFSHSESAFSRRLMYMIGRYAK